jgi:hypothetical protein
MIRVIQDPRYHYKTIFNTKNGNYIRFSDEQNAYFGHVLDVGVMG